MDVIRCIGPKKYKKFYKYPVYVNRKRYMVVVEDLNFGYRVEFRRFRFRESFSISDHEMDSKCNHPNYIEAIIFAREELYAYLNKEKSCDDKVNQAIETLNDWDGKESYLDALFNAQNGRIELKAIKAKGETE